MSERTPDQDLGGLSPIDSLLCKLLEGSATGAEKQEFLALVEADARFAGQSELFVRLRGAVLGTELDLDVLQDFLAALSAGDGWDDFADCLREEVATAAQEPGGDLTDAIMASVDEEGLLLSRLFDGELSVEERKALAPKIGSSPEALSALNHHATLGRLIREAVDEQSRRTDLSVLWAGIAPAIGMPDPEYVEGWQPIGEAIAVAVREHGALEEGARAAMAASIMERVESHAAHMNAATEVAKPASRRWLRWAVPTFAMAAAAAAMLFTPIIGEGVDEQEEVHIEYAEVDDAQIEDLEYADDVFVHVMSEEDGNGPLIIMIDEDAAPIEPMEDDGVWDTGMEPI